MTTGLRRWAIPALLAAVVIVLYGRTLSYDFVNYDDYDLVVMNREFLSNPSNIPVAFTTHAFTSHREESVYYRPFLLLTYFADYALWKLDPTGYHLTNVLLHCGAVLALYFLVLALLRDARGGGTEGIGGEVARTKHERTALFAALLFAVHPVQTESVAWVAGRNDVLLGLLLLSSFLCYAEQHRDTRWRRWMFPASAALFAAALLTKESAIFFLPLYPLYEAVVRREPLEKIFSGRNHLRVSTYLAIAAVYLVVRFNIFGEFIGAEKLYGRIPVDNRFLMAPGLAFTNLLFLLWPAKLSIVHPIENVPWFDWPALLVPIGVCAALLAVLVVALRRDPAVAWCVAWLAVGMFPLLNLFPLAVPILEHRLYAASAGFAVPVAIVAMRLLGPSRGAERAPGAAGLFSTSAPAVPLLITACVVLAALTWARLPVWSNSETLWSDAIAKEPAGARAYFNLAGYYFERQQFDRTAELLETYVKLKPEDFTGYTKLRQTYFLAGKPMDAARVCRTMIERDPKNQGRYVEAGILFEKLGIGDSVVSVYEEGLRVNPAFYQLHKRLGLWYRSTGDAGKAAWHLGVADSLARAIQSSTAPGGVQ